MIERMRLPAVLYALAWALVAVEPSLWPVPLLGFAQNLAHTFVSRGRNSGSLAYHVIASIFSNGIYVSLLVLSISIVGYMQASGIPIFIAVFVLSTMSGSVTAHILALRLEKGKARNVQEDKLTFLKEDVEGLAEEVQSAKMGLLALDDKYAHRLAALEENDKENEDQWGGLLNGLDEHERRLKKLEARPVFRPHAGAQAQFLGDVHPGEPITEEQAELLNRQIQPGQAALVQGDVVDMPVGNDFIHLDKVDKALEDFLDDYSRTFHHILTNAWHAGRRALREEDS